MAEQDHYARAQLGQQIKQLREEAKIPQKTLCRMRGVKVDPDTFRSWEKGEGEPKFTQMLWIKYHCGVAWAKNELINLGLLKPDPKERMND